MNEDSAALETLDKAPADDFRCMELRAQLLYRAENFEQAAKIFMYLLRFVVLSRLVKFSFISN